MSSFRLTLLLLSLLVINPWGSSTGLCQNEVRDSDKAVIAFDLRIDRLVESLKALGVDPEKLSAPLESGPPILRSIKLTSLTRIYGAAGLPATIDPLMQPDGKEPPFQFFVRIKFDSPDPAEKLIQHLSKSGKEMEFEGKTFQVENEDKPMALMAHLSDMTEVEIGTGRYLLHPNRKLMSEPLTKVWGSVPDHAFRVAIELDSCQELVQQALEMGKSTLPPPAVPFLELVDNASSLVLSSDLAAGHLLNVSIAGRDEAQAEDLEQGLQSLATLVKLSSGSAVKELGSALPGAQAPVEEIMKSLKVERTGDQVTFHIPVPDGLSDLLAGLAGATNKAAGRASEAVRKNLFRQAMLSAHNYASVTNSFPFIAGKNQNPNLSWQVRVLPYLEQLELYRKLDLSKGPDEEPNAGFADQMPEVLGAGGERTQIVWIESDVTRIATIPDGTSNTIALIEYPPGLPWLNENKISAAKAIELVQGLEDGDSLVVAFYDGSCRTISNQVDPENLKRLFDPKDGQLVDRDF